MIPQTIDDVAHYLNKGRMFGEAPVLILGAGASVAAGVKPMRELMPAAFKCTTFEQFCAKIGPLRESEIGHGLADSPRIQKLARKVLANGRALWFVNVANRLDVFASDPHVRAVTGESGKFEIFFLWRIENRPFQPAEDLIHGHQNAGQHITKSNIL